MNFDEVQAQHNARVAQLPRWAREWLKRTEEVRRAARVRAFEHRLRRMRSVQLVLSRGAKGEMTGHSVLHWLDARRVDVPLPPQPTKLLLRISEAGGASGEWVVLTDVADEPELAMRTSDNRGALLQVLLKLKRLLPEVLEDEPCGSTRRVRLNFNLAVVLAAE